MMIKKFVNRLRLFRSTFAYSLLVIIGLSPNLGNAQTVKITAREKRTAEGISAELLRKDLYFVASDEMGGRDTPSLGLDKTAEFLKKNLEKFGFKPAGENGTYFQNFDIRTTRLDTEKSFLTVGDRSFRIGADFVPYRNGIGKGGLVFASHGWMVKSKNVDAYSGVDVEGKIVVVNAPAFNGLSASIRPEGVTPQDLSGKPGSDWATPWDHAVSRKAAGLIIVAPTSAAVWKGLRPMVSLRQQVPEKSYVPKPSFPIPVLVVTPEVAQSLFEDEPGTLESKNAFAMKKSVSTAMVNKVELAPTRNVVAILEGSDPVLKNEMVAVGAHYDHVGTNPDNPGKERVPGTDTIWNGADDDGSGTVAVIAIARALAKSKTRPKRSVLLVWHAGEEKGLWGSEYFNKYPTVDIKNVVAQLNLDMIGRSQDPNNIIKCEGPRKRCNENLSKSNEIYVIGSEMMSSALGAITKSTNNAFLKLDYNYKYDDPKDKERLFFRSDHFNYAKNGIPIVFWTNGEHEDYHQPSDTADKIDYQKLEKITRTVFLTMLQIANLKERPAVDKQLPPELLRS